MGHVCVNKLELLSRNVRDLVNSEKQQNLYHHEILSQKR